ncbi:MAG: RDD family protein [Candidatus Omnitrophica bacterium]|nr:RDD family protein [Candidatus Omnitrophota bacterium]
MVEEMRPVVEGGSQEAAKAPKGKRFACAIIDLVVIPILLGIVAGLALFRAPEGVRNVALIAINVVWMIFRDFTFSPGRKMVGLKLTSLTGDKVTLAQAFIRNILLIIPFVLVVGYIVEIIFVFVKGDRLADNWAKTHVVEA